MLVTIYFNLSIESLFSITLFSGNSLRHSGKSESTKEFLRSLKISIFLTESINRSSFVDFSAKFFNSTFKTFFEFGINPLENLNKRIIIIQMKIKTVYYTN